MCVCIHVHVYVCFCVKAYICVSTCICLCISVKMCKGYVAIYIVSFFSYEVHFRYLFMCYDSYICVSC